MSDIKLCYNQTAIGESVNAPNVQYTPDLLSGIWSGSSINNELIDMTLYFTVEKDSVFWAVFSVFESNKKPELETFKGIINIKDDSSIVIVSGNSKLDFDIRKSSRKFLLNGIWINQGQPYDLSEFTKVGNFVEPIENPEMIISYMFISINGYAKTQNSKDGKLWADSLKEVYNTFLIPDRKFKSFENFKAAFKNTLRDSLVSMSMINKIENLNYDLRAIHIANEFPTNTKDSLKIFISTYQNDYKLINKNGEWKIFSSKSNLLKRDTVENKSANGNYALANKIGIKLGEITGTKFIGDTVGINFMIEDYDLFKRYTEYSDYKDKIKIYFDNTLINPSSSELFKINAIIPKGTLSNSTIHLELDSISSDRSKIDVSEPGFDWLKFISIVLIILSILFVIAFIFYLRRKKFYEKEKELLKKEKREVIETFQENKSQDLSVSEIKELKPQKNLIKACQENQCCLFVGSGIPEIAGMQSQTEILLGLVKASNIFEVKQQSEEVISSVISSLKAGKIGNAYEIAFSNINKNSDFYRYINKLYGNEQELPEIYKLIKNTSFQFMLTTNYDNLLEKACDERIQRSDDNNRSVYFYNDNEKLKNDLVLNNFFILKLNGKLAEPESLLFTPSEFYNILDQNKEFTNFIETVFSQKSVFFIGVSIEELERFLFRAKIDKNSSIEHFALAPITYDWKSSKEIFKKQYHLHLQVYGNKKSDELLTKFVKELSEEAPVKEFSVDKLEEEVRNNSTIDKIVLKNIGPFEELEIEFDKNLNVIIGDNGTGKTTILKAIAVAILAEEASEYAFRLIRELDINKKSEGTITIFINDKSYIVNIKYNEFSNKAIIINNLNPFKDGGALAIGIPALRTITWHSASEYYKFSPYTVKDDIIGLVTGVPELTSKILKNWFVYLENNKLILYEKTKKTHGEILNEFLEKINILTINLDLKIEKIDTLSGEIYIKTNNSYLRIEALSQGTLSILYWCSFIFRRLYEKYGDVSDNPLNEFALVLIDEIDAHMHPLWQQGLIPSLNIIFPKVQFIITTHSPLIIGGLEPEKVKRFYRDEDGKVLEMKDLMQEDLLGRADQVLTSDLFGLESTNDLKTIKLMNKYSELSSKDELTLTDQDDLEIVAKELNMRVLLPHEKKDAREAFNLIQEALQVKLNSLSKEKKEKILKALKPQIEQGIANLNIKNEKN